jgi:hypothetical protein
VANPRQLAALQALTPQNPDAIGITEISLATSPIWQMGPTPTAPHVERRDDRVLGFLASARNAPLAELEFDVLTWAITQWFLRGAPRNGQLRANIGDLAAALYGERHGGKQYQLIRQALENLYNVSVDLTVLTTENGDQQWRSRRRRRLLQQVELRERIDPRAHGDKTITIQLASWLIDQLDAQTVAAIAWQLTRRLTGLSKRLAIYLAAKDGSFQPITTHTERLTIPLNNDFYETMGITATRERDRRASVGRAAERIAQNDPRYTKLTIDPTGPGHALRVDRRVGETVPVAAVAT